MSSPALGSPSPSASHRWRQLVLGVACMVLIANLQYGWTLFVAPMRAARHWDAASIQLAFSIFIALETWFTPIAGWIADMLGPRRGPRLAIAIGGVMVAAGWAMNGAAETLGWLYAGSVVSGIGGGFVYATCVGNAVRWFPDRRGLAVGLTAAGFGAGAVLTVVPIRWVIEAHGYAAAFIGFGLGQGLLLLAIAAFLRAPDPSEVVIRRASVVVQAARSTPPGEILRRPVFWLLYVMFVLVSGSGLMATAQIALIARNYGVADTVLLFGASTLTVALIVDNVMNGAARPFFGWVSDRIGREKTMAIAFSLGAVSYWALGAFGGSPFVFVLAAGMIFFTWGEIFSLFPSTCTDIFGTRYASVNSGLLYTAKGTSAFLVPFANLLAAGGDWQTVFSITAATNVAVVLLALFVLPRWRSAQQARTALMAGEEASAASPS